MKYLFLFFCFGLMVSSCDTKTPDTPKKTTSEIQENTPNANKIPEQQYPERSAMVESEVQVPEKEVDDKNVDYVAYGAAICACAKISNELNNKMQAYSQAGNSQEFTKMAPQVNAAYEQSTECAKKEADALNSEFSYNSMVGSMKKQCGSYDDKLIWQIFMGLKNRNR